MDNCRENNEKNNLQNGTATCNSKCYTLYFLFLFLFFYFYYFSFESYSNKKLFVDSVLQYDVCVIDFVFHSSTINSKRKVIIIVVFKMCGLVNSYVCIFYPYTIIHIINLLTAV